MADFKEDFLNAYGSKKVGDLNEITKQLKVNKSLSDSLKQTAEINRIKKINQNVSRMIQRS